MFIARLYRMDVIRVLTKEDSGVCAMGFEAFENDTLVSISETGPLPPRPKDRACKICGTPIEPFPVEILGKWMRPDMCEDCVETEAEKDAERQRAAEIALRKANIDRYMGSVGVPKLLIADLRTIKFGPPPDVAKAFLKGTGTKLGLFLHGRAGRRKSILAARLTKALILRLEQVAWIDMHAITFTLRKTFNAGIGETTEYSVIEKCTRPRYAVLDDLGAGQITSYGQSVIHQVINTRIQNRLPTIITSNLSIEQVERKLGERIASRIAGMCEILKMGGPDMRRV